MYKKCCLFTILSILVMPVFAGTEIVSNYICSGINLVNKTKYTNDLTLKKEGEIFHLKWLGDKGSEFTGTGFLIKNVENHLVAEFKKDKDSNMTGVVVFKIESDGNLNATYVIADGKEIGSETCKKQPLSTASTSQPTDILEIVNKYNTFQQKIGNNTKFDIDGEITTIFGPNFKKIINGAIAVDGRSKLKKQLEDVKTMTGSWDVVLKEQIPCLDPNLCVIRYNINSKNSGNFDVMALLKKDPNGLIEEINEIYYKITP